MTTESEINGGGVLRKTWANKALPLLLCSLAHRQGSAGRSCSCSLIAPTSCTIATGSERILDRAPYRLGARQAIHPTHLRIDARAHPR